MVFEGGNILDPPSSDKNILWKEMKGEGGFGREKGR